MSFVEIRDLTFAYDRRQPPVIEGFSLSVEKGEILGVLGPSGSGKSTLLRLIAGLEVPAAGAIDIAGKRVVDDVTFVPPEKRGVGMVFQDYALFPHLTVEQNVGFGLHRLPRRERRERVREALELVRMAGLEKRYPHELSGGQQQRAALARALAPNPDVLLMDEPFSNLDADLRVSIRDELAAILRQTGMTCLFVTHDRDDVEAVCDRYIVMEAGKQGKQAGRTSSD
ncbi:MAG: ABC transporter [Paenibacillaceae bacterium ZCTH02-B3]|nr:MAG: ABC transporter [Paenibacillaceae bacterium ZCTH02-B3]